MRILILTQYYPPEVGAPQVRLSSFARELQRQGHDVVVLTGMPNYPSGEIAPGFRGRLLMSEEVSGVRVVRTWLYATNNARFIPRLSSYLSFCVTSLLGVVRVGRLDMVFVESPPLFLVVTAHIIAKLRRTSWIMNVSDLWPDTVVEMNMLRPGLALSAALALERWAYKKAAFVVGVTQGICDRFVQRKGLLPSRVLFLPNGADTELFAPRDPDAELAARIDLRGRKLFLFAGLHGHAQDLPSIIDAAERLRGRVDIMIGFVGGGPIKEWAQQEARLRGLTNVFFDSPQPLEAMPRYWSLATAALVTLRDMPLFNGARPSKSFPPMASGVPVIFAGKGEMRELLEHHAAGVVVPPEDGRALAAAMERLADDPVLVSLLGANARRLVLERFSWRAIVQNWLDEYRLKLNMRVASE